MSRLASALALVVCACLAVGCGETCIPSGVPMQIYLLDVEVGDSAVPSPYATTSEDDAIEFMDHEGLSFELPELPGGWSFVFLSTEVTPYGHMEWVTGALDDGAEHFVLLIDSDFPCEAPNDTGAGDHAVALWEVPHAGEVTACRSGRRCQ